MTKPRSLLFVESGQVWPQTRSSVMRLLMFGVLCMLVTGCLTSPTKTPEPTPAQEQVAFARQLVFEGPCQAPCWYGLELEQSSKADVLATLQSLPFFASDTVRETTTSYYDWPSAQDLPATIISPECIKGMEPCVGFDLVFDRLVGITILIGDNLFLDEVTEQYGPPDYSRAILNRYSIGYDCVIFLSWEGRQVKIIERVQHGKELCVSLDQEFRLSRKLGIDAIMYVLPGEFEPEAQSTQPWLGLAEP